MNLVMPQINFHRKGKPHLNEVGAELRKRDLVGTPSSELSHCGACCDQAKDWLVMMARSYDFSITDQSDHALPSWLISVYKWGPTQWPISWCQAVTKEEIDCGVFAAFTYHILKAKGCETYRAQVLLNFDATFYRHMNTRWSDIAKKIDWIGDGKFYHEVCAIVSNGALGIYDPTDAVMLSPEFNRGHGSVAAVNVESGRMYSWGQYQVGQSVWTSF